MLAKDIEYVICLLEDLQMNWHIGYKETIRCCTQKVASNE